MYRRGIYVKKMKKCDKSLQEFDCGKGWKDRVVTLCLDNLCRLPLTHKPKDFTWSVCLTHVVFGNDPSCTAQSHNHDI